MTIAKTAYHTFIGRSRFVDKVKMGIEDAQNNVGTLTNNYFDYLGISLTNGLNNEGDNFVGCLVTHDTTSEALIPVFVYPMIVEDLGFKTKAGNKQFYVVGDVRPFTRGNKQASAKSTVVNTMEFELLKTLMAAELSWLTKGPQFLASMSPVLSQVYCRWIGDTISRRFELDMTQRQMVRVLAAYFFQCCFSNTTKINDQQKSSMVAQACRSAGVPIVEFERILNGVDTIDSAEDFCFVLKKQLATPRLDDFNIGLLAQIMMGTWFGFNGRDLACAAIEHPPTFAAMLYMSFAQNSYKKAGLAQVSENFKGSKGGSEYVRNVKLQLLGEGNHGEGNN